MVKIFSVDLFKEIKLYLKDQDYLKFLNASKILFHSIKFETRKIVLQQYESLRFITDQHYRELVLEKIQDPAVQLKLIYQNKEGMEVLFQFSNCEIYLFDCSLMEEFHESFFMRRYIHLAHNSKVNKLPPFEHVEKMKIHDFNKLSDLSGLVNLRELKISSCPNLTDVRCLGKLYKLEIQNCRSLKDVSPLGNVHDLSLIGNRRLKSMAGLTGNHRLTILECPIEDLSLLDSCRHLVTDLFKEPVSEAITLNKRSVRIEKSSIQDTSVFGNVFFVCLMNLDKLKELKGLGRVPILEVWNQYYLKDISCLMGGTNRSVMFVNCSYITNFSAIKNVPNVTLADCDGFTNCSEVENVERLKIDHCSQIKDVSCLGDNRNLKELEILKCSGISSLPETFGKIPVIAITDSEGIVAFENQLGESNEKITMSQTQYKYLLRRLEGNPSQPMLNLTNYQVVKDGKSVILLRNN